MPIGFPEQFTIQNYIDTWTIGGYGRAYLNTLMIAAVVILVVLTVVGLGAYALSKLEFKLRGFMTAYFFVAISLPSFLYIVPDYSILNRLGLINTRVGLTLVYIAMQIPFNMLLLKTFLLGIPRALEDGRHGMDLQAQDVAEALLNYAPFEHGFFWWGGYGISTEHTAYLNLRNGIPAPKSGSIEQNGSTIAEQIGGQIFIDTWGLVSPGNPDQAAKFAREAASVTHDGNGIYGGIFIAVCISYAFVEKDIAQIIQKGLSYIPEDCEYARVVQAVMSYHKEYPDNWRECFHFIHDNYGYDKYPGNCHIIPNIALMILALLYGNGDFSDTLNICNMCGWDTDCNVGNVAAIMGVRNGLEDIDYEKWRKPINDFLACSSVMGSMNLMDIPYGAVYIAKLAYMAAGEEMPEFWREIAENRIDSCHFEFPGSTHAMRIRMESVSEKKRNTEEGVLFNTDESVYTGKRSLKFIARPIEPGEIVRVYKKTYYEPLDFADSRYDPFFSPLVYPGQTVHGSAMIPEYGQEALVSLYVKDIRTGEVYESAGEHLTRGEPYGECPCTGRDPFLRVWTFAGRESGDPEE